MQTEKILAALDYWDLGPLEKIQLSSLGNGLIHGTFLVESPAGKFVLQQFNQQVFQHPNRIAANQDFLAKNINFQALDVAVPLPIPNHTGERQLRLEDQIFRLFEFIEGVSLEFPQTSSHAYLAAKAYATLSATSATLDLGSLEETIPNFHRLDLRYRRFLEVQSVKKNWTARESTLRDYYLRQKPLIDSYQALTRSLPFRLTHNDTKLNNLIFSKDLSRVEAIVDLDTLMPGYLMYDFGDLVRTAACPVSENSSELDQVLVDLDLFESLLKGYLEGFGKGINPEETESLLIAGEIMTCMMGLRFFTDHLEGNIYYRVAHPEANLVRATNQMVLLQDQQAKRAELRDCLQKIQDDKN
ncbi:phosphotransferase enzyme family protein [Algoriphagus namhaensis]